MRKVYKVIIICICVVVIFILGYAFGSDTIPLEWLDENWEDFFPALGTVFAGIALIIALVSNMNAREDSVENKKHIKKMEHMEQMRFWKLMIEEEIEILEVAKLIDTEIKEIVKKYEEIDFDNVMIEYVEEHMQRIRNHSDKLNALQRLRLGIYSASKNKIEKYKNTDGIFKWAKDNEKVIESTIKESEKAIKNYSIEMLEAWDLYERLVLQDKSGWEKLKEKRRSTEEIIDEINGDL